MEDKSNLRLGALLREIRTELGVSQRELARGSAVPETRLSAIERGRVVGPGRDFVERVSKALRLPQSEATRLGQAATHDRCLRDASACYLDHVRMELIARAFDAAGTLNDDDCASLSDLLEQLVSAKENLRKARKRKEAPS